RPPQFWANVRIRITARRRWCWEGAVQRRTFLRLSAAVAANAAIPFNARAAVAKPYSFDATPPMNDTGSVVRWLEETRGEDARYLRARFERFQNMVHHVDLWETRNKRAFLASMGKGVVTENEARGTLLITRKTTERLFEFSFRLAERRKARGGRG